MKPNFKIFVCIILLTSGICYGQSIPTRIDSGARFQEYYVQSDTMIAVAYTVQVRPDSVKVFPQHFTLEPCESQILTVGRTYKGLNKLNFELIIETK